jgi:serine/threonine protein kinase
MFTNIKIPPSFSLIKKGKVSLLLRNEYKDPLLQQVIENPKSFIEKSHDSAYYLNGRTPHPSIPLKEGKRMVVRQYSHGGLLRAITGNLYLSGARSFRELAITEEIRSCGIPTIEPIGAIHQGTGLPPLYRAYLLTLEVPGALNGIQYLEKMGKELNRETLLHKRKMIRQSGLLIRQFHQSGFFHQDLQLKNILVAGDRLLLIDFDRSYRKSTLSARERMRNLLRLNRSVEKWRRLGIPITHTDRWRFFLAYAGDDKEIKDRMVKTLRTYSLRFLFYRLGWTIEEIVGSGKPGVSS